ncbi:hypothetical protein [Mucilaginibacter sp. SMC90]|nr:hypothetical protein [Mucilaginibacter sp. SMC90]
MFDFEHLLYVSVCRMANFEATVQVFGGLVLQILYTSKGLSI